MENNQQKWVNLSFAAAAVLVSYVLYLLAMKFSVLLDIEGRVRSLDKIVLVGSVLVGVGLFLALYMNKKADQFMNEVVAEVTKVTWPGHNETVKATIAVIISVVIAGIVLWLMDSVWAMLIGLIV